MAIIWHRLAVGLEADGRVTRVVVAGLCRVRVSIADDRLSGRPVVVEDVDALTDFLGALIGL